MRRHSDDKAPDMQEDIELRGNTKTRILQKMFEDLMLGYRYYPAIANKVEGYKVKCGPTNFGEMLILLHAHMIFEIDTKTLILDATELKIDDAYFALAHQIYHTIDPRHDETNDVPYTSKAFCRVPAEVRANTFAMITMNKLGLPGIVPDNLIRYSKDLMEEATPDIMKLFEGTILA